MKKAFALIFVLFVLVVGWKVLEPEKKPLNQKPFIAVSNFPLYEISTKLLGDSVEVKKLIPFGVETHTYRPSVKTMTQISQAKLFLYSGLGMEPWLTKTYDNGVDTSEFVELNPVKESHEHEHQGNDPHYWLKIENMIRLTSILAGKFERRFPKYKKSIEKNADDYITKLRALQVEFNTRLQTCQLREIVVNHNAFGYLAQRYNFHTHYITGLSPDEQASAKKMKEISDLVIHDKIKVIFFEDFVSDKVARTIASETGAEVDSLQPLANVTKEEAQRGYVSLMRENLQKISKAMLCQ